MKAIRAPVELHIAAALPLDAGVDDARSETFRLRTMYERAARLAPNEFENAALDMPSN